jgi:hypothetical protein
MALGRLQSSQKRTGAQPATVHPTPVSQDVKNEIFATDELHLIRSECARVCNHCRGRNGVTPINPGQAAYSPQELSERKDRLQVVVAQIAQLFLTESLFVQQSLEHLRELRITIVVFAVDLFTTLGEVMFQVPQIR